MFTDTIIVYMATGEASYDLTCAMNGALAGLVAITAGCAVVTPFGALPIGIVAGWVYLGFSKFLIKMKIDDAVDAIPVHFANGIWGVIAVGLFAETDLMGAAGYNNDHTGWFYSWGKGSSDATLLVVQLISVLWICGWVAATRTPFFLALNALGMFRVDAEEEEIGLDISHHRGAAYDLSGPSKENMESFTDIRAARQGEVELPKEVKDKEETAEKIFDC
jgi:Amt family ammonium transporter